MLISHKHKFITIDIPKTGTTSLVHFLSSLGVVDFEGCANSCDRHGKARFVKFLFEKWYKDLYYWGDYKKFCIVRDPWKRYLSYYVYRKNTAQEYRSASNKDLESWNRRRLFQGRSCSKWLSKFSSDSEGLKETVKIMNPQYAFIHDNNGSLMVDYIANTENIEVDIKNFLKITGIKCDLEFPSRNKSEYDKPYHQYFNQEIIDMIAEKEKWVIDKFGYTFRE